MQHLGDGPFYYLSYTKGTLLANCQKYWWTNFLFINNFYPWSMANECNPWVWYLANDFQFFIISPPLVYLYCRNRKASYWLIALMLVATTAFNAIASAVYGFGPMNANKENPSYTDTVYSKPYGRIGPYLIGAIVGLAYFEMKSHDKFPELKQSAANAYFAKMRNSLGFCIFQTLIGFGLMFLFIIPLRQFMKDCSMNVNCWSMGTSILFSMFNKTGFMVGMCMVIMPTFVDRFKVISYILGSEFFAVTARLTYCVYMFHIFVILWLYMDASQAEYNTNLYFTFIGLGVTLFTFLFAIPMTLVCEAPFLAIEKYILFPTPRKISRSHDSVLLKKSNSNNNKYNEKSGNDITMASDSKPVFTPKVSY